MLVGATLKTHDFLKKVEPIFQIYQACLTPQAKLHGLTKNF